MLTLLASLACVSGTGAAWAATSPDESLDEVVVTGSRIPINETGSTTPLTVLDSRDIQRSGLASLGALLQALPFNTGSPMNTNVNNGGDGSERLDLRGLGPRRTVVLLNGHRFPNGGLGGDDSVDLSQIPLSLVSRVEVLTSGAGAIYGADAVAGVVNVITRETAPGLQVDLGNSLTERGDGRIATAQLVGGRQIAGGTWSLGADFARQEAVLDTERAYSAIPFLIDSPDGTRRVGGTKAVPDGEFDVPAGNLFGLPADSYVRIPGSVGQGAANYRVRTKSDVFFLSPYMYLQTPTQRGTVWLLGSQPLRNGVTLFAEGLWHVRRSEQHNSPSPIIAGFSPMPTLSDGSQGVPASNWYNPFGVDIEGLNRRLVELPDRRFRQRIEAWRALLGARGAAGRWHWEVAAATAQSTARSDEEGLPSALRLIPALGPSGPDASGHIVCGARDATGIVPAASIIAGCVPLDLFGGAGSITREQIDYLNVNLRDRGSGSHQLLEFNAEGPWGQLPAGPLLWAFGAEYRREGGSYRLDPLRKAGVTGESIPSELQGATFDAREIYFEGRATLLKDRRAARLLALSIGARQSKFSSFGADSTWQAGLRWSPVDSWTTRMNYAQVFRAPDLGELYQSQILDRTSGADPCGNNPTQAQQVNCAANGVPGGSYAQDPAAEWNTLTGGARKLVPERGSSFDAGIELRPVSIQGLSLSVDYFNVDLGGFIEALNPDVVLQQCADRGNPSICGLIHRASDGSLRQVDVFYRNLGRLVASGYDFAGDYAFRTRGTRIRLGFLASYLQRRDSELFPGEVPLRLAGAESFPHLRANAHLDVDRGRWKLSYAAQFVGTQTQCSSDLGPDSVTACFQMNSVLYHDLAARVQFGHGLELRVAALNLTNRYPPFLDGGTPNADVAQYRLLGRTYSIALGYSPQR